MVEKSENKEKNPTVSKAEATIKSEPDVNPDETIISTNPIVPDIKPKQTAKKPPVKRKPRKKPVKANVDADNTDKASEAKDVVTKTKVDESRKN
ncbi:MAG: hypothetical protein JKY14_05535 [Paraglaciecola sp.]|nr:hypothetical protein [Paraglaciecola sp.]